MKGVKPCIAGIILATGLYMAVSNILTKDGTDIKAAVISLGLLAVMAACKRLLKKKLSPVGLIVAAALMGMVIYA